MDKKNIESIYPLAPLQQAFLWHSLQTSAQAGLLHVRCTLSGELKEDIFHQAWNVVVGAHPALRTSVHWEDVKQPLQVVARQVKLPWAILDWREKESSEKALASKLENFLREDSDRSFDLTQAPITRITLIRLAETTYELVWSCHHLMLDGWSGALVLNQVVDAYENLLREKSPAISAAPTFQAYIRWQQQQDSAATQAFWQKTLAGFIEPTELPFIQDSEGEHSEATVTMTGEETAAMNSFLRSHRLTLNTLMQGVWSLLLQGYSRSSDVLFGATVSGRQGDLPSADSIVGLLINVLPVRVQIFETDLVLDWLRTLQHQQSTAVPYAHAALSDIQQWCEVPGRLFESLLVIENYPVSPSKNLETESRLRVENMRSGVVSTYGLTVLVKPGESLTIAAESAVVTTGVLSCLLSQFVTLLQQIVAIPHATVAEVLAKGDFSIDSEAVLSSEEIADGPSGDSIASEGTALSMAQLMVQSPLELTLLKIWSSILGPRQQQQLSVEDSFFDWGGSSLLAVQLFNEMQRQLDCTLPLATLFQAPTVRKFAALLAQSRSGDTPLATWSSLVPIQPNGTQWPFFFHGGSADALTWARFSQLLGADQPFYAFQRPDLDGREVTMMTVEELAADCVKEMRMVQPKGPYIVGGHCFGGAIAFEIAQQLQAEGQKVASLILIDAYRPAVLPSSRRIRLQTQLNLGIFWLRKNYYYYGNRKELGRLPGKLWEKVSGRRQSTGAAEASQSTEASTLQSMEALASENTTTELDASTDYEVRYAQAIAANDWAAARYQASDYCGTLKLFRADIQMLEWYFGESLGWQTLVKDRLSVTFITGFFGNLFNQSTAPVLAEQVKAYLATLPASEPPSDSASPRSA